MVGSLVIAVALAVVGQVSFIGAVADLARAPGGCTTTLDVVEPGTYAVFVESRGELRDLPGDCPFSEGRFRSRVSPADVDVTALTSDGSDVAVLAADGDNYNTGDRAGRRIASLVATTSGRVQVTVTSPGEGAVVAVGIDPTGVAMPWRVAAAGVAIVGLILGAVLIGFGLRRRSPAPASQPAPWGPPQR